MVPRLRRRRVVVVLLRVEVETGLRREELEKGGWPGSIFLSPWKHYLWRFLPLSKQRVKGLRRFNFIFSVSGLGGGGGDRMFRFRGAVRTRRGWWRRSRAVVAPPVSYRSGSGVVIVTLVTRRFRGGFLLVERSDQNVLPWLQIN